MSQDKLLKAVLGEEIFEGLTKALEKLDTKSVVDIQELRAALKVVPKSVMAFLIRELKPMEIHESKEIDLPYHDNATMRITKDSHDVYHGDIQQDGKMIHEFDLVSIPQLAAHLVSTYELYEDERGESTVAVEEGNDEPKKADPDTSLEEKIKTLESKIDQIMVMLSQQKPQSKIEKSEKKDLHAKVRKILSSVSLNKAGVMPTMPKPPAPGRAAGRQGLTEAGFHGDKTAHTDLNPHPVADRRNPWLKKPKEAPGQAKQPKQPKQPKTSFTAAKSENSKCTDCGEMLMKSGEYLGCSCFKALSKPDLKKSESTMTFTFDNDWDSESRYALWITLNKDGRHG